ncbi:TPA: 50S ribosomal protein L32e [Candidatus Bathyarchaeota archaeon]|nr:50S ribosomal protein L32e [Candidatus Bathyarchaeota archaeon]
MGNPKKPKFKRQESWRYIRVKPSWRRPRGNSSRMRKRIKGLPKVVSVGYGNKKELRGLHPSGYKPVLIHNLRELEAVDGKTQAVLVAHSVGEKKRTQILERAKELNLKVLNPPPVEEAVEEGKEGSS